MESHQKSSNHSETEFEKVGKTLTMIQKSEIICVCNMLPLVVLNAWKLNYYREMTLRYH